MIIGIRNSWKCKKGLGQARSLTWTRRLQKKRFKNKPTGQPKLFQGNLYGPGGHFIPCDSYPIKADPLSKNSGLIMNFGEALVECIDHSEPRGAGTVTQPPIECDSQFTWELMLDGSSIRVSTSLESPLVDRFHCDMAYCDPYPC